MAVKLLDPGLGCDYTAYIWEYHRHSLAPILGPCFDKVVPLISTNRLNLARGTLLPEMHDACRACRA